MPARREMVCKVNEHGLVCGYTDVEIVRCGDCAWFKVADVCFDDNGILTPYRQLMRCDRTNSNVGSRDFCSRGERRSDG